MKLTTKGRYAVTAMLDLALHAAKDPVTLPDIAKRNRISPAYLEQLFARLRRQGLVESLRGPGGGYRLARDPQAINVASIVAAVNEDVDATRCGGARNCHDGGRCLTHDLWEDLTQHIQDFLQSVTLAELSERATQRGQASVMPKQVPLRRISQAAGTQWAAK
jgi:Rrf2 family iron-sulfur cluster assembly transcriptional regulator